MVYVGFPSELNIGMRVTPWQPITTKSDPTSRSRRTTPCRHCNPPMPRMPAALSVSWMKPTLLTMRSRPGGEFVAEELVVQVIPQAQDEFTCYSCFLVRHRSQVAREKNGHAYCVECEG